MKRAAILSIVCLLLLPVMSLGQSRQRTTTKRTTPKTQTSSRPNEARTSGATRIADQIKNLTRFIYLLGGVAKSIEAADAAASAGDATPTQIEQTTRSKTTVKTSLANVREGLDKLEIDFRSTPELQRYYISLAGVAAGASAAEDNASAGRYDQAGRALLNVVNRLTDVLLEMR